jgi:hypothetical protein
MDPEALGPSGEIPLDAQYMALDAVFDEAERCMRIATRNHDGGRALRILIKCEALLRGYVDVSGFDALAPFAARMRTAVANVTERQRAALAEVPRLRLVDLRPHTID